MEERNLHPGKDGMHALVYAFTLSGDKAGVYNAERAINRMTLVCAALKRP